MKVSRFQLVLGGRELATYLCDTLGIEPYVLIHLPVLVIFPLTCTVREDSPVYDDLNTDQLMFQLSETQPE